ncbi:Gonadal protein gdl [Halotydeus destructor]|nr:Gonadal protein gdl [Halotydeus destructor]
MARDLPMQYQQRLPYELLSSLASCLLDDSIFKIVEGLKDIQQITEKSLFEKRQKFVDHYRVKKLKYQKELMDQLTAKEMPYELAKSKEKDFEREMEEAVSKFDMKLMLELDQAVSDQQETLESTGVPGFHVTNNATEIRIQMYIIEFITRLSEL